MQLCVRRISDSQPLRHNIKPYPIVYILDGDHRSWIQSFQERYSSETEDQMDAGDVAPFLTRPSEGPASDNTLDLPNIPTDDIPF